MSDNNIIKTSKSFYKDLTRFSEALPLANLIIEYRQGKWTVFFYNQKLLEVTGYSDCEYEEMIKDNSWQIFYDEDLQSLIALLEEVVNEDKQIETKYRINSKKGSLYTHLLVSRLEQNDDYTLLSCVFVDILNPKDGKANWNLEMEESDKIFSLIHNGNQGIFKYFFDTDTFELYNNHSKRLLYMLKDKFTIKDILESNILITENLDQLNYLYVNLKAGVPKGSLVIRAKGQYGQWGWYQVKYITAFDKNIKPSYSVVYYKNITEERNNNLSSKRFHNFVKKGINNTFLNIEYNLTRDIYEIIIGDFPKGYKFDLSISLDENVHILEKNIHPEDRNKITNFLSLTHIVSPYIRGKNPSHIDFRAMYMERYVWVRLVYHMIKDPYTSDYIIWLLFRKIKHEKESKTKLIAKSEKDELTGLYNRSTFEEKTKDKMNISNEDLINVLVIVDIDNFKKINDTFGYIFGDKVIKEIAGNISLLLGKEDIVGRLYGTNFLIYIYGATDIKIVEKKLEFIIMSILSETKDLFKLSVSIGASLYGPDGKEFYDLYEKAYLALYKAKKTGQDRYIFYYKGIDEKEEIEKQTSSIQYNEQIYKYDSSNKGVDIRTFGYFDIFVDGQAILITHAKAKELLALLVQRRGGFVTSSEIISHLWEDEATNKVTMARCRKVFMLLKETLKKYDIEDILESKGGARRIIPEKIKCDLYNYLSGDKQYANLYKGYYMLNYTWSEFYIGELEEQAKKYLDKT